MSGDVSASNLQSNYIGTIVRFVVDVTNLSNQQNIISPTVTLNNLEWSVGLRMNGDFISISLRSHSKNSFKYSCDAQANFKLYPQQKQSHVAEKSLRKLTYTDTNSINEISTFIDFSNFKNYYVIDNRATFEIEISTILSKMAPKSFQQIYSRLHITLDEVSQLNEVVSTEVILRDIRWKVRTQRQNTFLNIYLEATQADFGKSSTYDVTANIKLLRFDNGESYTKSFTHEYHSSSTQAGVSPVLYWSQFLDKNNKFVFQDRAHILVEFKVAEPKTLWNFEKLISIN